MPRGIRPCKCPKERRIDTRRAQHRNRRLQPKSVVRRGGGEYGQECSRPGSAGGDEAGVGDVDRKIDDKTVQKTFRRMSGRSSLLSHLVFRLWNAWSIRRTNDSSTQCCNTTDGPILRSDLIFPSYGLSQVRWASAILVEVLSLSAREQCIS